MFKIKSLALLLALAPILMTALAGRIDNAELKTLAVRGDLGAQIASIMERENAWVTWSFARVPSTRITHGDSGPCNMVLGRKQRYGTIDAESANLGLFIELRDGEVVDVDMVNENCPVDGNGQRVYQISGVDAATGIATLARLLGDGYARKVKHGALAAIALHDHAAADATLAGLVDNPESGELAEQAVFWLGEARGATGFQYLQQFAVSGDIDLRRQVTFGLHVSREPGANDVLFSMAREDASDKVRSQAIFWLAQKGAPGILDLIDEVLAEMPGKHLVEQSIFALSQISDQAGANRLKQLAGEHENSKIRATALFWLAQSGGDEAFDMLASVLQSNPSKEETDNALMLISQSKRKDAAKLLVDAARNHQNSEIRSQALFWLSQSAASKISETLMTAVDEDPDTEVKKQAVFGISQRPKAEAVPLLINLMREHKNAEVRKQALFWLGQLGGDEALAAIEEVLEQ